MMRIDEKEFNRLPLKKQIQILIEKEKELEILEKELKLNLK